MPKAGSGKRKKVSAKRRDPAPRPIDPVDSISDVAGKDPQRHYVLVNQSDRLARGMYARKQYVPERWEFRKNASGEYDLDDWGQKQPEGAYPMGAVMDTTADGDVIDDGMGNVLMSCPLEVHFAYDKLGQGKADERDEGIIKHKGDFDPMRGLHRGFMHMQAHPSHGQEQKLRSMDWSDESI